MNTLCPALPYVLQLELPHGIAICNYNGPKTDELSFQVTSQVFLVTHIICLYVAVTHHA